MKEQDDKFIKKRDQIRKYLRMSRIGINKSTQFKLAGAKWNGVINPPLSEWEVEQFYSALEEQKRIIQDMQDELKS